MLEMLLSKRQEITSDDGATEKREPLHTVGRNVNWCSHYGKQYGDFSKKLKVPWGGRKSIIGPTATLLSYYPKETKPLT